MNCLKILLHVIWFIFLLPVTIWNFLKILLNMIWIIFILSPVAVWIFSITPNDKISIIKSSFTDIDFRYVTFFIIIVTFFIIIVLLFIYFSLKLRDIQMELVQSLKDINLELVHTLKTELLRYKLKL